MAPRKKPTDDFDELKMKVDSLREKTQTEGTESSVAARNFRKLVIAWLTLLTQMIVWLYQYTRANQAAQKEMDEEALLEGAHLSLDQANDGGPRSLTVTAASRKHGDNGQAEAESIDAVSVDGGEVVAGR